jgi:hypothetical protein
MKACVEFIETMKKVESDGVSRFTFQVMCYLFTCARVSLSTWLLPDEDLCEQAEHPRSACCPNLLR